MFDLTVETPIPLSVATDFIPPGRGGKRTHISTLLRWITHGSKAPDGRVVRLEAARVGARWFTSKAAIHRFSERLTPAFGNNDEIKLRTLKGRERASARAARELEDAGI